MLGTTMFSLLSRLFPSRDRPLPASSSISTIGYTYSCEGAENRLANASVGSVVKNPDDKPPWIVVDRNPETMVITRWPGRLLRVEVLTAAPEQIADGARYVRAISVRVISEEPVAVLFGPHGQHVCRVLDAARTISIALAKEILGSDNAAEAREAYSAAWNCWIARVQPDSQHLGDDHRATLSASGLARSPIGGGFGLIYSTLFERAKELAGDASFSVDEEGEVLLAPEWAAAADALLHAAMALGAPENVSARESVALLASWRLVESATGPGFQRGRHV